jgi:phenylacetate-CoA ligase
MIRTLAKYLMQGVKETVKPYLAWIPYGWRRGPEYWKWKRFLEASEVYSLEQIEQWQLERLKEIVSFAYHNTRGYRELFAQLGVTPEDIRTLDDIVFLPFTTKEMLRDNLEDFSAANRLRFYTTTGGSTGIPFGFYLLYENGEIEDAFIHHYWERVGWRPDSLNAILRGAFIGSEASLWKVDEFRKELLLSSYYLGSRTLDSYIEVTKRFQPKVLQAYPSSLNILCDLLLDSGRVGDMRFDLIILASENLYDWMLDKFESVFPQSGIYSFYGHAERTILAPWCETTRYYHICPFYGFTEIIGPDGREVAEGEEGELVGTSFHMRGTPFIRYKTNDRAIKGAASCPSCGRPFRLIKRIVGRSHEVIVTATGRYISMTALNMHSDVFDHVRQFQFYQDKPGEVAFRVARKDTYSDRDTARIYDELKQKLGDDMKLTIEFVEEIPKTSAGKFRFLDQRLAIRYHDS